MESMTPEEFLAAQAKGKRQKFGNTRTVCLWLKHKHASKIEAEHCPKVYDLAEERKATCFREVRFVLPALAPNKDGRPEVWTADFALWDGRAWILVVEVKGSVRAMSRDFKLRLSAFKASYPGVPVQIWTRDQIIDA